MNKRMCLRFLIICFICLALVNKGAYASPNNAPPSFEEKFIQAGYTSVEEAVEECEHYFNGFPKEVSHPQGMGRA
ncbi:MAG: hypothetical protein ACI35P_10745, partial [Bacillus sp. (in: firmicutes)]